MNFRLFPLWWPLLGVASPALIPFLMLKNKRFKRNLHIAEKVNAKRLEEAEPLNLPELEYLELTVLVDEKTEEGYTGEAGVSYILRSDKGALLFDVAFGPGRPALKENAILLNFDLEQVDGVCISHLHPDHMGGLKASRSKSVIIPEELGAPDGKPCYLPDKANADGFTCSIIKTPQLLNGGIATTGPLSRSLFFMGMTEEQALFARIKGKGLVVITGCGHPTIELIVKMVRQHSDEPIYAIAGGLHFPVTNGRGNRLGIKLQTILGTGKPFWKRITDDDLDKTIVNLNQIKPEKFLPSAHDTCDHALYRFDQELDARTEILRAGKTYRF